MFEQWLVWNYFSRRSLVKKTCPTLTVGGFFRRVRSTFLFIGSTTSNLNNFEPQQLKTQIASKTKRKNKTDVQNLEITLRIPHNPMFFGTMRLFLKLFGLHQRVPLHFFYILQRNGCQKISKCPLLQFLALSQCSKNLILKLFGTFFKSPKRSPSIFFHILQPAGVSQSPKGPPFPILS